jgi:vacuolar-type H+-ATPase subunit B/Vma2
VWILADGDKATGFKSMVVAQFTGIGLQKDDNAFVLYDNENTGVYDRIQLFLEMRLLSTNSRVNL